MRHVVDENGSIVSYLNANYDIMVWKDSNPQWFVALIQEATLSVGQRWFVKIGKRLELFDVKIIGVNDATIKLSFESVFGLNVESMYALKDVKFIERIK